MTVWLSRIPSETSFVIAIVVANVAAVLAMLAARRWSHRAGMSSGPAVVNSWATAAGALCAVLFAFSIVTLWGSMMRANANVDDEASAVRAIVRDLLPSQAPLLLRYVRQSVGEWPQLCGGTRERSVDDALNVLDRVARARRPAYADDLYRQLTTLEELRDRRWELAVASVPGEVWFGLIVTAAALLVVLAIALPERRGTHLALMLTIATSLGALFWVTLVLEYPFCGSTAIQPAQMMHVVRIDTAR